MKKLLLFSFFIFHFSFSYSQYMIYGVAGGGAYYTANSNPNNYGVIYSYNPMTNKQTVLFSFNDTDGYLISGRLLYTSDSLLYGITDFGGTYNMGTVFSFNPKNNIETTVVNFDSTNGYEPGSADELIQAKDGLLYATSWGGGSHGKGVLYSYDIHTHKDSVRYNFDDSTSNSGAAGACYMELWQDTATGMLYGVTEGGGFPGGGGVVYGFNPTNNQITRYFVGPSFTRNNPEPEGFCGGLSIANNGLLYGMALGIGTRDSGTIYSFNTHTGNVQTVYSLGGINGAFPNGNELLLGSNGLFYAGIRQGGELYGGYGVLCSFNPSNNTQRVLKTFHDTDGSQPWGRLIQDPSTGLLYGITGYGGDTSGNLYGGYGVFFSYDTATNTYTKLFNFIGLNGTAPVGLTLVDTTKAIDSGLAVSEIRTKKVGLSIYPNPSNGIFQLEIKNEELGINNMVEIYNVLGEKIYQSNVSSSVSEIDLSSQPQGVYFYRIMTNSNSLIGEGKLVKE